MPSPFPGMDPFIESQRFDEFHSVFLVTLADLLVPMVRPKYSVDVERYVFLTTDDEARLYKPDLSITEAKSQVQQIERVGSVATLEPRMISIPDTEEDGQQFLTIRSRDDRRVITMIELLSPVNKDPSGGQREYLAKRANYLRTLANIVEIDLLRGGKRLPSKPALSDGDYSAYVIRHGDSHHVEGYTWKLQDRLPIIPIPLSLEDQDIGIDLQNAFLTTYERRGYDYILNYRLPLKPPLSADMEGWVLQQIAHKGSSK